MPRLLLRDQRVEVFNCEGERWVFSEGLAGGSVPLPCLGGELSVDAVYDGVELSE